MEVVVTTGAISRAKLQSNHQHQQTNIQFFYRPDALLFLSPNQQCQSTERKISRFIDLLTSSSPGVFQLCLWPLIAPSNLGGGLPCLSSALWCQYPICDHDCRIKILLRFISFHRRNSVCTSDLLPVIQHSDPKRELRRRNGLPAVPWANEVYTEAWLLLVENGNSGRACMKVNRLNLVNAAQLIYKSIKVWKQTASR